MRRKNRLKILLIILISIFIMFAAAALLLASFQKSAREAQQKKEAIENAAKLTPTPEPTAIPSPSPTPRPTATPTPVPEQRVTFNPDDFWDYWYSTDGLVTINVYNISQNAVSFSFYQTDAGQTQAVSADITAEVAGNAAAFSFGDSAGNSASGNLTFDNGQLYLRVSTAEPVSSVYPNVSCIMSRNQVVLNHRNRLRHRHRQKSRRRLPRRAGNISFRRAATAILQMKKFPNIPRISWNLRKMRFMRVMEDSL